MLKNPKAKGGRAEREVKHLLEKENYLCSKTGGSLGIWDIICITPITVRLIQVKSTKRKKFYWSNYKKDLDKMGLIQEALPACCRQEIWVRVRTKWQKFFLDKNEIKQIIT